MAMARACILGSSLHLHLPFSTPPFLTPPSSSPLPSLALGLRTKRSFSPGNVAAAASSSPRMCASSAASVSAPASADSSSTESTLKKRIVSGVQPTGSIHLGNYLGAIKTWVSLQDIYNTFFFIVDLHAITLPHDAEELSKVARSSAAIYLSCGIDPSKASIFLQSHVRAHTELAWLLNCITPIGWLNRMIQFKEKSRKAGDDNVGAGLLTYPVLMAADILLYQCDLVPVGDDQRQHLELTRDIAERFNIQFGGRKWKKLGGRGGKIFKVPEAMIPPVGARVMSLTDGLAKMSKSAPSDQSRINLLDSHDAIANKIKRCKTDSFSGMEFGNPERPECNNLLSIYQVVSGKTKEEVEEECRSLNWGQFKPLLIDALISHLDPIQSRYNEVIGDVPYLDSVLAEGADKASMLAEATLANARQAMGFLPHQGLLRRFGSIYDTYHPFRFSTTRCKAIGD